MNARLLRSFTHALLYPLLIFACLQQAIGQTYPDKPVRLVVPFAPGGPADALGRILGEKLSQRWGQAVVIENRGGAGGHIRAPVGPRAAPDGFTLLLHAAHPVINPCIAGNLPYHTL